VKVVGVNDVHLLCARLTIFFFCFNFLMLYLATCKLCVIFT